MLTRIYLFSGGSAVGKTAVLKSVIPLIRAGGLKPCVCKIDCLDTRDDEIYKSFGIPCVAGLSRDICPDHFLVSNLTELMDWSGANGCDTLVIETAGLCHRCSPATRHMTAGCVLDCTISCKAPYRLGPMLTEADFVVLTKTDMVSQAELEIISCRVNELNPGAEVFPVDGLAGYGADLLSSWLLKQPAAVSFEGDILRNSMPGGVCSYCVGERRVGTAYQQGIIGKIDFGGAYN